MAKSELQLPHDLHLEREILGCCFFGDPGILQNVRAVLNQGEFHLDQNQRLFKAICDVSDRGDAVTWSSVYADMHARGQKIELSELTTYSEGAVAISIESLLKRQKELARRRALMWQAKDVMHRAGDITVPLGDAIESASAALKEAAGDDLDNQPEDIPGIIESIGGVSAFLRPRTGLASPWNMVNHYLGGWQKGDLILIGARPSMGKTALLLNTLYHAAAKLGKHATLYSYEMTQEALVMRLVSMLTGLPYLQIQSGDLNASERRAVSEVICHLGEIPLRIKQASGKTALSIRVHAERLKRKGMLDIAGLDYIGLMRTSGRYDSRNHELGESCRQLKETATDLKVPFIVLSQLSRAAEGRTDKRPIMSDLRDSGDLESHADVIGFVHRPGYYNRDDEALRNAAELIISKQRNGDTPIISLFFRRECGLFQSDSKEVTYGFNTTSEHLAFDHAGN